MRMESKLDLIRAALLGIAVGDALGVPFEFNDRSMMRENPCTGMVGHGTHDQPAGTWSDDSSMTFCLAEALSEDDFELDHLGRLFVRWFFDGYWTAHGVCYDYGSTTAEAIKRLERGLPVEASACCGEGSNGNGSLMRILPLVFFSKDLPVEDRFEWTRKVSAITHGHIRSIIACHYYLEFARLILQGLEKEDAYRQLQKDLPPFLANIGIEKTEFEYFNRLLVGDIASFHEDEIQSDGYVLHTLEASMWCLLTTGNFRDAVLTAVGLGGDTDTTAAVIGGLAGLVYGVERIPEDWLEVLARRYDIEDLARRMATRLGG
jgi:ADP-ribosylglycohydrolase